MSDDLNQLESDCQQAAAKLLALEWRDSKPQARAAVEEMLSGSRRYTASMSWLLEESAKLPVQAEPARHLKELVTAISALRTRKRQVEAFSSR